MLGGNENWSETFCFMNIILLWPEALYFVFESLLEYWCWRYIQSSSQEKRVIVLNRTVLISHKPYQTVARNWAICFLKIMCLQLLINIFIDIFIPNTRHFDLLYHSFLWSSRNEQTSVFSHIFSFNVNTFFRWPRRKVTYLRLSYLLYSF